MAFPPEAAASGAAAPPRADEVSAHPGTPAAPAPELGPEDPLARDAALEALGWERRFTEGAARLRESVALYESLGWEVRTEPLAAAELADECHDCTLALALFRILYVRRRA